MNPVNKILQNNDEYCPHCKKKMNKYVDSWAVRGYTLACVNPQCEYNKKEGGPFLRI